MYNKHRFDSLVERYSPEFGDIYIYGTPIAELNKEELKASICLLMKKQQRYREDIKRERTILAALRRLR